GDQGRAWGFHFGYAFRRRNPHFERLTAEGVIFSTVEGGRVIDRFQWLGGFGQWGVPGWTMPDGCAQILVERAAVFACTRVLELGTSRGRMSAMLASLGCAVTPLDHVDRGAAINLAGLPVEVILDDAIHYLSTTARQFDLIVCDLHGNSPAEWQRYCGPLI